MSSMCQKASYNYSWVKNRQSLTDYFCMKVCTQRHGLSCQQNHFNFSIIGNSEVFLLHLAGKTRSRVWYPFLPLCCNTKWIAAHYQSEFQFYGVKTLICLQSNCLDSHVCSVAEESRPVVAVTVVPNNGIDHPWGVTQLNSSHSWGIHLLAHGCFTHYFFLPHYLQIICVYSDSCWKYSWKEGIVTQ